MSQKQQISEECDELIHSLFTEVKEDILQGIERHKDKRDTLLAELDVLIKAEERLIARLGPN